MPPRAFQPLSLQNPLEADDNRLSFDVIHRKHDRKVDAHCEAQRDKLMRIFRFSLSGAPERTDLIVKACHCFRPGVVSGNCQCAWEGGDRKLASLARISEKSD